MSAPSRLELYRHLRRIRLLDERMVQLQRQGRVGFHGSCAGQEAVPVAVGCALRATDWVFPALRESSLMLVRGYPLERYVAQSFGCALDLAKGRQMPSHQSARAVNVVSWSSAIGTQLPQAVGMALAARKLGKSDVSVAFLGDGATSHPDFHAALNFAGVFRAPCVFVCQNNQLAISVPVERQSGNPLLFEKARAYGIPGQRIDGNDVEAVLSAVREAADSARGGGGPSFLECLTYRVGPHSSSDDPSRYRSEADVRHWRERDPIDLMRARLVADHTLDDGLDEQLTRELSREISRAIELAAAAPAPAIESLFDDVYAKRPRHLHEQARELLAQKRSG